MLAVFMVLIILFVGMAIDLGLAYVTKASLSKAVDAAVLAGAKNLSQGKAQAETLARKSFALNYQGMGLDASTPSVAVDFPVVSGYTEVKVSATTNMKTFFLRILPQYERLVISADAQAFRANLLMSVVLDRSGSLSKNGGWQYLPTAVGDFIDNFDDNNDQVSMVSFASDDTTDAARKKNFKASIHSQLHGWGRSKFDGGTYAMGGLARGKAENESYTAAIGENVLKVVVFFTDGQANSNEDVLDCSSVPIRYGGCSPLETGCGVAFWYAKNPKKTVTCGSTHFPAQAPHNGGNLPPHPNAMADITADAEYRMLRLADSMRAASPYPTVFYVVGLGDENTLNKPFLQQLANDIHSPAYNSSQPAGEALFTNDPSELEQIFQEVASKIQLRLTQ
jgi:Flp pilus assembly protein TadG